MRNCLMLFFAIPLCGADAVTAPAAMVAGGRVNGALLWPDAFAYLARELGAALAPGGSPGGPGPVN